MRWWMGTIALGASCTARPFVDVDDDGGTSGFVDPGTSDSAASAASVSASVSVSASATTDDGVDEDVPVTTGGPEPECEEPTAPQITVDLYPGEDPLIAGMVARELDCVVADRSQEGPTTVLAFECDVSPTGYVGAFVLLEVDAQGVTIPAELDYEIDVHVRVQTYRDAGLLDDFPWVRTDHIAIYRDDVLVLGVGAGGWWPETANGGDFWAPVHLEPSWSSCDAVVSECHEVTPGSLVVVIGEEKVQASEYSVVSIGGYDVHVGEQVASDSPNCGEPTYTWMSFAIAPTP